MKVVESFPHTVEEVENCWIALSDGCRLAARMWLPHEARNLPVPAIVEYIPYRKRDGTRLRDEPMHRYFAGHGYAAVRVDLRGTGESDGLLRDEYLEQEQLDGAEVIGWIAAQPWCNGRVGMMGKSWGGFNALQIAARRPPQLKAIITACSTDDRYADDAHFMGGCLLNENLAWGSLLFTHNAQPPDPALVGDRWRSMWIQRLENNPLFLETWLAHQRRDDYWKQGSVCEDFAAICCPVYAIGGWADGYTNAVPRLLAGLSVPRKGLIGPWAHVYPHQGVPRPAIGFLQEALRWWDHWLKGIDRGIMDEPMLRVWMQDSVRPKSFYDYRPGRWVAERTWPSPRIATSSYRLAPDAATAANGGRQPAGEEGGSNDALFAVPGRLRSAAGVAAFECRSPQSVGLAAGAWCGFGIDGEMPADQRSDDAGSLVFDSAPLAEGVEILGAPRVVLLLAVDRPQAIVAVRLNDVSPDGASTRVTYGLLNLAHRDGHEQPSPLEPGRPYKVAVQLNDVAHSFALGHRLRLAISTSYWPIAWPAPEPVTLTLLAGGSHLELPVRPPDPADARLRPFEPPEGASPAAAIDLDPGGVERAIHRDPVTGETVHITTLDADASGRGVAMTYVEAIDLAVGHAILERFTINDDDPLSARAEIVHRTAARRGEWSIRIESRTQFWATPEQFCLQAELRAFEGDTPVFTRTWERSIPRDSV